MPENETHDVERVQLDAVIEDNNQMREEMTRLEAELATMRVERNSVAVQRDDLQLERDELRRQWDELKNINTTLRSDLLNSGSAYSEDLKLRQERDELRDQLHLAAEATKMLQEKYDDLGVEHASTERRLYAAAQELRAFKQQVVEVAVKYMKAQNLCADGMTEALDDLGLQLPITSYQATARITVRFTAERGSYDADLPEEDWVNDSINKDELRRAIENTFSMDSDHESSSVDEIEIDVINVQAVDD